MKRQPPRPSVYRAWSMKYEAPAPSASGAPPGVVGGVLRPPAAMPASLILLCNALRTCRVRAPLAVTRVPQIVNGTRIYNKAGTIGRTKICDATNTVVGKWPSAAATVQMGKSVLLPYASKAFEPVSESVQ